MQRLYEAVKIDGFDEEQQHAFDKLAGYFAVFKSRTKPTSLRYITRLNEFQLKFMEMLDKAESQRGRIQIQTFIKEIRQLIAAASKNADEGPKNTVIAGGKIKDLSKKHFTKLKDTEEWVYANPDKNGGEYMDGDIHTYEMPTDEDPVVNAAIKKLTKRGFKITK